MPTGSAVVVKLPTPSARLAVPSWLVPLKKVMVPVGVPEPGLMGATVAVSVTASPISAGLRLDVRVVVVEAWATATETAEDVLLAYVVLPPYTAVSELVPALSFVVLSVATPEAFSTPVPRTVEPLSNVTVPLGVPEPELGLTVAVSVMSWPVTGEPVTGLSTVEVETRLVSTTSWPSLPPL